MHRGPKLSGTFGQTWHGAKDCESVASLSQLNRSVDVWTSDSMSWHLLPTRASPLAKPSKLVLRAACHHAECVEMLLGVQAGGDTTCSSDCQHHRVVQTVQCSLLARMHKSIHQELVGKRRPLKNSRLHLRVWNLPCGRMT